MRMLDAILKDVSHRFDLPFLIDVKGDIIGAHDFDVHVFQFGSDVNTFNSRGYEYLN